MQKLVSFTDKNNVKFYIEIELINGKFSMRGNGANSCGQCQDSITPANIPQADLIGYWKKYHLNDMKAGTPAQMKALASPAFEKFRQNCRCDTLKNASHYDTACAYLKKKRLYSVPDPRPENKGKKYTYGSAWLKEELPADLWADVLKTCADIEEAEAQAGRAVKDRGAISGHEAQALDFMDSTGTTFTAEFLKYDFHFPGDKEERDVYKITLSRGTRKFSFNFGHSINSSGRFWRYNNPARGVSNGRTDKKGIIHAPTTSGEYGSWSKNPNFKAPTAYDVLACLTKSDPGTFENFCDGFGYDTDSRTAEKTYKAVVNEYQNVCMLWNDEQIAQLQEIN